MPVVRTPPLAGARNRGRHIALLHATVVWKFVIFMIDTQTVRVLCNSHDYNKASIGLQP